MTEVDRLGNFINGIGATRHLLTRARSQGFLIEALVLYTSITDGFCRMALLLNEQIQKKTNSINEKYISQDESGSYFTERNILKLTLDEGILDQDLFDELSALYDVRNKMIHRFLLSPIEYSHLEVALDRYELIFQRLWTMVYNLEERQILQKTGMTVLGKSSKEEQKEVHKDILRKIRSGDSKSLKNTLGSKLIKNPHTFSEDIERERISDEISEELEIQKEKRAIPTGFTSVKEVTGWAHRKGLLEECQCGHLRVRHIDTKILDQKKSRNLEDGLTECAEEKCSCKKFMLKDN